MGRCVDWSGGRTTLLGNHSCRPLVEDEKWLKELLGVAEQLDLATQAGLVVKMQH